MNETEKQVVRFNWQLTAILIIALLLDIGLVWGFARLLMHLKPLL